MTDNRKWIKSSYSGAQGGNCIEVAGGESRVLVRDTKDRTGPELRFTNDAWRNLVRQIKQSLASQAPKAAPDSGGCFRLEPYGR